MLLICMYTCSVNLLVYGHVHMQVSLSTDWVQLNCVSGKSHWCVRDFRTKMLSMNFCLTKTNSLLILLSGNDQKCFT